MAAGGSNAWVPRKYSSPAAPKREGRSQRNDAARRRQRGFERHHHEPDRGERGDPAGLGGHRGDETGQRQRREHMRTFILPGARQVIGGEDRQHQPGEHQHFERTRHAADRDIKRQRRQRDDAAQQPRRDESAMTRRRQRIASAPRDAPACRHSRGWLEQAQFIDARPSSRTRSPYCSGIVSGGT